VASQAISSDASVEEYISTDQLPEDPLRFKQNRSCGLFCRFHYTFSCCYFLLVRHRHDNLVATSELSHILTNTINNIF